MSAVTESSTTAHLSTPGWGRAPSKPSNEGSGRGGVARAIPSPSLQPFTQIESVISQSWRIDFREELGPFGEAIAE
jgi:hypothetical protein